MKKGFFGILLLTFLLLFSGCAGTVKTEEEMLTLARKEIPLSDAETIDMEIVGRIDEKEETLLIIKTGNEFQSNGFYPVSFKQQKNAYRLSHVYRLGMSETANSCFTYLWKDSYVILVANEDCVTILITNELGEEETVAVNSIPFLYQDKNAFDDLNNDGESKVEYLFLDNSGKELE